MLYQLHELQHASFAVFRTLAKATLDLYGHPLSPLSYTPFGRSLAAGSDLLLRTTQRYAKPPFGLNETVIDGQTVAVTEEVALEKPFCKLLHFKRDTTRVDPVVLMVAPLSGHFATLLRDTVKTFLPDHDVYITDWVDAKLVSMSDGPFHFDDYVAYVMEFIRHLGPDTHVISVCQPTVPVLVALSLFAASGPRELPRSMIMMGGPIDTRKNPTTVNNFAKRYSIDWFERRLICRVPANYPGFMRRVYPGFLQHAGFVAMNPGRHIASHREYYYHLVEGDGESARAHRAFYDEYNAVLDLPAEYYLETVERVFQRHQLPMGDLISLGERVRPELIETTALMTVEGELDDISGNGQTAAAHDLCSGIPAAKHRHLLAKDVGHYGIFSGRRFRENIYPEMREFIREHAKASRTSERRLRRV
jgi:poly(3-hydroxybutyrate) depolymerase